jgi:hypothetical protein
MLMHRFAATVLALSVVGCQRLSPAERSIIGTWRQQEIDGAEYHVFNSDHSYAYIHEADENIPRNTLICGGSWRIEGDDLITDCTMNYDPDSVKGRRGPERHVERERLAEFARGREKHAQISYDTR